MNDKSVIPYMYEAWEFREGDIDLNACKSKGIPVVATNEDALGIEVFDFVGPLCVKMLFELEIEVHKSKIVIISSDRFGRVIEKYLRKIGADVYLVNNLKSEANKKYLEDSDALVIADFTNHIQISGKELIELSRKISVIQFAGDIDIDELERYQIPYFPKKRIGKFRMGMTFADLGPKPLIDLHTAGLKVGEIMARLREKGYSYEETIQRALENDLCQDFDKD